MKKQIAAYVLLGLVLLVTFSFQGDLDHTKELSAVSAVEEGMTEVTPGLSLSKGSYTVELGTYVKGTTDDAVVQFYSPEQGVLLEDVISNGINVNTYALELSQESNIVYIRILSTPDKPVEVHSITVRGDKPLYTDYLLFLLVFIIAWTLFGVYYFGRKQPDTRLVIAGILGLGVFLSSYPLLSGYLIEGHDLNFQLYRIEGIKDALLSGQFPVRIHPTHNNGYGYATPIMYPELFLYFPALLRMAGLSIVTSFKFFLISVNILTAVLAYYSFKELSKSRFTATLGAFIYVVSSYRTACVIQRNAVGEILGLAFLPLIVAGFYNLLAGDKQKWYQLVIGATGILQSHMITTLFTAIFAAAICVVCLPQLLSQKRLLSAMKALAVVVLLNLWYIVPFFDFMTLDLNLTHTTEGLSIFYNNAVYPAQLFNLLSDQFGYSHNLSGGMGGELSMTLGYLVTFVMAFCALWYLAGKKDKGSFSFKLFLFGLLLLLGSTTLVPWQRLQGIGLLNTFTATVQFPWRFLGPASVMILSCGVMVFAKLENRFSKKMKYGILAGTLLTGVVTMVAFGTEATKMDVYLEKGAAVPLKSSIGMNNEYLLYGTEPKELTANRYETSGAGIEVVSAGKNGTTLCFTYRASEDGYVEVPLLWYPGYRAKTAEGRPLELADGDNHALRVQVPDSGGKAVTVQVSYSGKMSYHIAEVISLLSLLGGGWYLWKGKQWLSGRIG